MSLLLRLFIFLTALSVVLWTTGIPDQLPILKTLNVFTRNGGSKGLRPNVVFILTDDQDLHMDSLSYMPLLKKHLLDEGTFFKRHYCTIAVCCPSRVSLWTGKTAHNTNVTDVAPPYGGYPKFISQGLNDKYLPVWIQEAGYNNYYTGKLFNWHTVNNYDSPYPAGFTGSDFLLDPFTYSYLNSTYQRNQDLPKSYEGHHTSDVIAEKAYGFLDDAAKEDKPFFLTIAPIAPHSNLEPGAAGGGGSHMTAPIPAKRHAHLFQDVVVPRTEHFNPDQPQGVSWIKKLKKQKQNVIDDNDYFYRARLQSLQAVDELIEGTIARLEALGILDNTYIIYTSDNGFHIGQHRLQPGKECGYEEDINVPLIIRGPGVPKNTVTDIVTTHTDIAPTVFEILGLKQREDFDGAAIPLTDDGLANAVAHRHEHVNVEYWGWALEEGIHGIGRHWNNTYKALRLIGDGYNLYYSVWCSNEHELYDLETDPYQQHNLYNSEGSLSSTTILSHPLSKVVARLDALLMVLKSCKSNDCIEPWAVLHPYKKTVHTLKDALHERFDDFYAAQQQRVSFSRCENGYIIDAEGPQTPNVFLDGEHRDLRKRDGLAWSEWT